MFTNTDMKGVLKVKCLLKGPFTVCRKTRRYVVTQQFILKCCSYLHNVNSNEVEQMAKH